MADPAGVPVPVEQMPLLGGVATGTFCLDQHYCRECMVYSACQRAPLHKGFHTCSNHKWDEYGDVEHI